MKFTDNYDFMTSKYGLDETLVYDRRNSAFINSDEPWGLTRAIKRSLKEIGGTPLSAANLPLGLVKIENLSLCTPAPFIWR